MRDYKVLLKVNLTQLSIMGFLNVLVYIIGNPSAKKFTQNKLQLLLENLRNGKFPLVVDTRKMPKKEEEIEEIKKKEWDTYSNDIDSDSDEDLMKSIYGIKEDTNVYEKDIKSSPSDRQKSVESFTNNPLIKTIMSSKEKRNMSTNKQQHQTNDSESTGGWLEYNAENLDREKYVKFQRNVEVRTISSHGDNDEIL